jgi:hypothetical protein
MDQSEIEAWGSKNGWRVMAGALCLCKPRLFKEAIVRIAFKATVASLEVKKPAGKWEKIGSAKYADITEGEDWPEGLGFEKIPSFSMLMAENRDAQVFAKFK